MKRIAVLTSGGDAPGMNAAIRAVVRAGVYYEKEVFGVYEGYEGLIAGNFVKLKVRSVNNILHRGGTFLKSARSEEFRTPEGRKKAIKQLKKKEIDGLVVVGGDGTFTGAMKLSEESGIPIIGIPGTIDNDLAGTDYTLGFDTATNTVAHAIDQIRDTALSHNRLFFIEVMGRNSGAIAVRSGIAGGAVATLIPEKDMSTEALIKKLDKGGKRGKTSSLVVVAEAGSPGRTYTLADDVKKSRPEFDVKVTVLGHLQRGGSPSCFDRVLASRLGVAAIEGLIDGKKDVMAGIENDAVTYTTFKHAIETPKPVEEEAFRV
ncbi:6-phosphofructokinase, partial [Fulvivirga sp. RKSG066]|uniref:6-phosphofructokinase n=1 Tax=Fulvivirga aurantia TaxID=2529383 RepID=UPI0012BD109C